MRTLVLAAMTAAALFASPAVAMDNAEVGRVLKETGLIGVWSPNCADIQNHDWEIIGADASGQFQSMTGGDDYNATYDIVSVRRLDHRDVELKFRDAEAPDTDEPMTLVYRVEADRQMTWSSISAEGEPLITAGQFEGGPGSSEWYLRCPHGRPTP